MFDRPAQIALVLALSLSVAGCYTVNGQSMDAKAENGSFCEKNPAVCVIAGVVIAGGVVGAVAAADRTKTSAPPPPIVVSDRRLKEDIRPIGGLANGIRLYAFRYRGDDRYFVSPMAQDLLKDARFRDAVSIDSHGFYQVDMSALGLEVVNGAAMHAAGIRAAAQGAI
jgi:predicted small secreted protein